MEFCGIWPTIRVCLLGPSPTFKCILASKGNLYQITLSSVNPWIQYYCWWKKSCGINYLSSGAGFFHQQYGSLYIHIFFHWFFRPQCYHIHCKFSHQAVRWTNIGAQNPQDSSRRSHFSWLKVQLKQLLDNVPTTKAADQMFYLVNL